jgi:hypothetical protein
LFCLFVAGGDTGTSQPADLQRVQHEKIPQHEETEEIEEDKRGKDKIPYWRAKLNVELEIHKIQNIVRNMIFLQVTERRSLGGSS